MKKLLILTSVLILAACGGGGGGGSGTTNGAEDFVRSGFISDATNTSNSKVTSMTSAVVVAKDGSGSAIRSATNSKTYTKTYNGKEYNVYTLDDVKFLIAENPKMGYFQFGIDADGRIARITENLGDISDTINRNGDTARFEGPIFEYVEDGKDEALMRVVDDGSITLAQLDEMATKKGLPSGHWNRIHEVLEIKTFGKDLGLQFSDFGHFNPVYRYKDKNLTSENDLVSARSGTRPGNNYKTPEEMENEFANSEDYQLFAGGYAISGSQIKDTLDPTPGMSFKGTAIGRVYSTIQTDGVDRKGYLDKYAVAYDASTMDEDNPLHQNNAGHDIAKSFKTNGATLQIDASGKQILKMPFGTSGFYDVTVTKQGNAAPTFVFDASTKPAQDATYGQMYRRNVDVLVGGDAPGGTTTTKPEDIHFTPGYYGINTPSEAAGTVRYKEKTVIDSKATREWEFQAAYGMKKQ